MTVLAAQAPIDIAALWRKLRYPVVAVIVGLALITLLAAIGRQPYNTPLDPRNPAPDGGRALASVLKERGVQVTIDTTVQAINQDVDVTILITDPSALSSQALGTIARTPATVVLVDPAKNALTLLAIHATPDARTARAVTLAPGCSMPAAVTAGAIRLSGDLYAPRAGVTACYRQGGDAAVLESTRANGATSIALGSPSTLTNAELATEGDAALALGVLNTPIVEWVPGPLSATAAGASQRGLFNLLPARLLWATLQLFLAAVVLALWRMRRLGRPVVEPLPVVVRAAETVEGRGRLMHAAHARGVAAGALRSGALRRITRAMRLAPDADPVAVVALVAERARVPAADAQSLLYGGEPADDRALVSLAQQLPQLEMKIAGDAPPADDQEVRNE